MSRVRLTSRDRQGADGSIPYPGNVNQERKDPKWDEYHTFEQKINHELPDMRHDWKDDERDDIGFGVPETWGKSPTVASVRVAANKSVRIAVLLLGEKVDDDVIEAQARDLMTLSGSAMDRTLSRFADTQKLYAEDEKDEDDKDEAKEAKSVKSEIPEALKENAEKMKEKSEDKPAEKKAEDKPAEKVEEKKDDAKEAKKAGEAEFTPKIEKPGAEADKKAADEKPVEKVEDKAEEKKAGMNEMDIELTGAADEDEEEMDSETAAQLASLFEGKDGSGAAEEDVDKKVDASRKAGIRKLGGQPRVAGAGASGVSDISSIWETAPDVSEVFK